MTSKEALKDISYLILQEVDNLKYKDLWKEALNTIKQDLERLEKENEQLKGNETIICDYAYSLKQENEKLKKVIEILKEHIYLAYNLANEFRDEQNQEYYVLCRLKRYLTKEQYYFLKEVLGDA